MDYKRQNQKLKEKLQDVEKQLNDKTKECELVIKECQKSIKAFQAVFAGVGLPQAIKDYAELYDKRFGNKPVEIPKGTVGYVG